jgi:hypothetical protein
MITCARELAQARNSKPKKLSRIMVNLILDFSIGLPVSPKTQTPKSMQQSKLIELLRKIPQSRLNRFREFLCSPYFNKNDDNILLFNYLEKYLGDLDEKKLDKKTVIEKLVVSRPLDDKLLAHLMNQQLGLLEKFLAVEQFLNDDFGQQQILMQQFSDLQLPKHYRAASGHAEKTIAKSPLRNTAFFQKTLILKSLQYEHADPTLRNYDESLQAAADALDTYFVVEKLRLACKMTNLQNILNIGYRMPFIEHVLEWSATEGFSQITTIQIYRRLLLLLHHPEDTAGFAPLKIMLAQNEELFEAQERKEIYTLLLNHCTRRINRYNDQVYLSEYLEINKSLLENGLIFERGNLQPWRFTNLVHIALKLGQTDWVHNFIHQFKGKLPAPHADNVFTYNLAQYHFHLGDLDKAQKELHRVDFSEDVLLNIGSRSLLIKIYYESGQLELLHSFLEATRLFLHRNNLLSSQMKQQMQKFVEYTAKLARLEPFEKEKLDKLLQGLPPSADIMHRDWIADRIAEKLMRK